ncbi:MAG: hypothetical protein ACTSXO_05705 [Candidatus Heimdallarchaeota archaeon]
MRRSNGGVIWLLIAGAALAFGFNQVVAYLLQVKFFIPSFLLLVLSGYVVARIIGRVGGEFSAGAKPYSILLEGFVFGLAFDLLRMRYDWIINIFKHIALGTFFILIALAFKSNLEKYTDKHPKDGPHLGLLRVSLLYIFAGVCFGFTINNLVEAFLQDLYFIALLPFLLTLAVLIMITAKADFDLLSDRSGTWQQLLAGGALGVTVDLLLFKIVTWRDLLNVFVVFAIFVITASVIRMKEATAISSEGVELSLPAKKGKKKKKVVGTIELTKRPSSSTKKYTRPKKERSSKYKTKQSK